VLGIIFFVSLASVENKKVKSVFLKEVADESKLGALR